MKVEGEGIVVVYGEQEYAGGEEFIIINETTDVNFMATFSVKNTSDADIETKILTIFDPGTLENPFELDAMTKEIELEANATVHYNWVATTSGTLIVSKSENKCVLELSKFIDKTNGIVNKSEEDSDGNQFIEEVVAGDEISILIFNTTKNPITVTLTLTVEAE